LAVSRALRRLLRIRDLEEEQARLALESAAADLRRLEQARTGASERNRRGRLLVQSSAGTGELPDRLAGLEESRAAVRVAQALAPRIARASDRAEALREEFLAARVERRQAETLIEEAEARDALDAERRAQMALDDWFRNRQHRAAGPLKPQVPEL
jgi:phage protein D